MSSVSVVNERADIINRAAALNANIDGANGLMEVLKKNLGPCGDSKLLVGGGGTLKMTKDGAVLLQEMQIKHPTASMIARAAAAQDAICGDGTTMTVLFVGELMRQAERYIIDGNHPRALADGITLARELAIKFLDDFKDDRVDLHDRRVQEGVVFSSVCTKINHEVAKSLTNNIIDAFHVIKEADHEKPDLHMVEIMPVLTNRSSGSELIKGIVMDHGCRHPDMPTDMKNVYVLTCNVNLEYEKSEINASFYYTSVNDRAAMAESERVFVSKKVQQIIDLKNKVCQNGEGFIVLNQKGIDPISLDSFARNGIMALRRVKRRNMERLTLCCGGTAMNNLDDVDVADLGWAGSVREMTLGDEKWTIVDDVKNPKSCTIVVNGPGDFKIQQIKDAIRDGLRSIYNMLIVDKSLCPGAGAFQLSCAHHLRDYVRKNSLGIRKLGILAFAEALLIVPKTLVANSGYDGQNKILLMEDALQQEGHDVGISMDGSIIRPSQMNIWDNTCVILQKLSIAPILATQLLMVDEIIRAGKSMGKQQP